MSTNEKLGTCRFMQTPHKRGSLHAQHGRFCEEWREQPAPGEPRTCEHCGGRVFIESTHGPGKCVPAQPEAVEKPRMIHDPKRGWLDPDVHAKLTAGEPAASPRSGMGAREFCIERQREAHKRLEIAFNPDREEIITLGGKIMCEFMEAYAAEQREARERAEGALREIVKSARNGNEPGQTWVSVPGGLIDAAEELLK